MRFNAQSNCGVLKADRCTLVTWTLLRSCRSSQRKESVKPRSACFAAQYGACKGIARYASAEPTCTITPRSRGRMRLSAASVPCTPPRYVTSVARLICSPVSAAIGPKIVAIALLTHTSMRPHRASTAAAAASTCASSATSVGIASASAPACSTSRRTPSRPRSPRASKAIRAPGRANARAVARPMPPDAPVMTIASLLGDFIAHRFLFPLQTARAYDSKSSTIGMNAGALRRGDVTVGGESGTNRQLRAPIKCKRLSRSLPFGSRT